MKRTKNEISIRLSRIGAREVLRVVNQELDDEVPSYSWSLLRDASDRISYALGVPRWGPEPKGEDPR